MTRPFSRPMTGMCHSVTARSMSRSIFSARLVIMGAAPHPALARGRSEGSAVLPLPCGERAGVRGVGPPSSCGGHPRVDDVGEGIAPVPLARLDDLAGQRASHDLL